MATEQPTGPERELEKLLGVERFDPPGDFVRHALVTGASLHEAAERNPAGWWAEQARELLHWDTPFQGTLDDANPPFLRWFADGRLNASYNCLDRFETVAMLSAIDRWDVEAPKRQGRPQAATGRHQAASGSPQALSGAGPISHLVDRQRHQTLPGPGCPGRQRALARGARRRICVLVGPSGCGKTTAMRYGPRWWDDPLSRGVSAHVRRAP